jgi:hypothetical protein
MRRTWVLLALLAGCESASEATPNQDVTVELAAVTLGDECGANPRQPAPPAPKVKTEDAKRDPNADRDADSSRSACEPTTMQLALKAVAAAKPTTIKVKKVELLDDKGKVLETLTAKQPVKWDGKKYNVWNESIAGGESLATSYLLNAPDWNKHTKGRRNAHTKKFQVRVTLAVGTQNRTIDKQAVVAVYIEPDVDT